MRSSRAATVMRHAVRTPVPTPTRESVEHVDYFSRMFRSALTSGAMSEVTDDVRTVTGRPAATFAEFAADAARAWLP